jgi:DNA invertase Pin-like site-specific DNA recombinase
MLDGLVRHYRFRGDLADSRPSDILPVEQVDRLSRRTDADWKRLRKELSAREVRVVGSSLRLISLQPLLTSSEDAL